MAEQRTEAQLGKGLHLAHLNIRSLMGGHKFDTVRQQIKDSGYDVFTLSETWMTRSIPDNAIGVMGYDLLRWDREWSSLLNPDNPKRGGGLAIYIKKSMQYSDSKHKGLNVSTKDLEMMWLSINLKNVRPIVVVTVYRPPQGDYKKCCEAINSAFEKANLKDNTDIFVLGDFNINFDDKKSCSCRELDFTMQSLGLRQVIETPTRTVIREGILSSTRIDLIFTNSDSVADASTLDMNLSDHLAVSITRKKSLSKMEKIDFRGRSYKNYDKAAFQNVLINDNWDTFFATNDPNKIWAILKSKISRAIDDLCPIRTFRVKEQKEAWITHEALEAIRDKDRALKRAKRSGREEDWATARLLRNRVGRDLENLRADYLKNQQVAHKNDPKKFWRAVSSIMPNNKSKSNKIWLKDSKDNTDVPLHNVAGFVNKFFTNIGPDLAKEHYSDWEYFGITEDVSIEPFTTNADEVKRLCANIIPLKSSGMDELSSRICKDAFLVLTDKLVYLFNSSLSKAIFPDEWKVAKVVPLYKGGDRENVSNYRPVSLLPLPGKLLEKIVHNQINGFWEDTNFLSSEQGGFRKGFSTTSTIADLTSDLFDQINKGNTTSAAFIDLSKAFDTVNLDILMGKLERSGIRGLTLKWCKSYLANRKQCTVANGFTSEHLNVQCGVPQGSVLGPLFFLVYVNDVQFALDNCGLKLYADDTVLYHSGLSCEDACSKLQQSINLFVLWCSINKLTINAKKTKLMMFGSRQKVKRSKGAVVKVGGAKLSQVPSFKYLGMTLDSTLNFNQHLMSVTRTILHKLHLLSKMRRYLVEDTAINIYKSMLLPYFDYGDVIYDKANAGPLKKLQTLQNKCLRLCLGRDNRFSTDAVHKLSKSPFLKDRRHAHVLNFMYKRKDRKDLLNVREIRTRAHDAPLFNVPIPRCEAFKRSIGFFGATEWNSQPPDIRNTETHLAFKALQKKTMLQPLECIQLEV